MGMASHLSVLRLERACAWEVGQSVASTRFRRFSELFTVTKLLFSSKDFICTASAQTTTLSRRRVEPFALFIHIMEYMLLLALCAALLLLPALIFLGAHAGSLIFSPRRPQQPKRQRRRGHSSHPSPSSSSPPPPPPPPPPPSPTIDMSAPFLSLLRAPSTGIGDRFGAWMNLLALAALRGERVLLDWPPAWRKLPPAVARDVVDAASRLVFPPHVTLRACRFEPSAFDMVGGWQQLRTASVLECQSYCELMGAATLSNRSIQSAADSAASAARVDAIPRAGLCRGLMYSQSLKRCQLYRAVQPECTPDAPATAPLLPWHPPRVAGGRGRGAGRGRGRGGPWQRPKLPKRQPSECAPAPRGWVTLDYRCTLTAAGAGAGGGGGGGGGGAPLMPPLTASAAAAFAPPPVDAEGQREGRREGQREGRREGKIRGVGARLIDLRPSALGFGGLRNSSLGGGIGGSGGIGGGGINEDAEAVEGPAGPTLRGSAAVGESATAVALRHRMGFANLPPLMYRHWKRLGLLPTHVTCAGYWAAYRRAAASISRSTMNTASGRPAPR